MVDRGGGVSPDVKFHVCGRNPTPCLYASNLQIGCFVKKGGGVLDFVVRTTQNYLFFPTEVANSSYAGGVNVNDHVDIDHNLQLFSKKVFCFNKEVQTSVS